MCSTLKRNISLCYFFFLFCLLFLPGLIQCDKAQAVFMVTAKICQWYTQGFRRRGLYRKRKSRFKSVSWKFYKRLTVPHPRRPALLLCKYLCLYTIILRLFSRPFINIKFNKNNVVIYIEERLYGFCVAFNTLWLYFELVKGVLMLNAIPWL